MECLKDYHCHKAIQKKALREKKKKKKEVEQWSSKRKYMDLGRP